VRWIAIWAHTLFGRPRLPAYHADPDLARYKAISRDQELRLRVIDLEAASFGHAHEEHHVDR